MITRLLLRRGLFITTENTPNPNSLKFMPGRDVLGAGQTYDFPHITDSTCSPLAKRIFSVQGVQACMFGPDYISITRVDEDEQWSVLKPELYAVITDFFNSNLPIINESVNLDGAQPDDDEDDAMFGSFFT